MSDFEKGVRTTLFVMLMCKGMYTLGQRNERKKHIKKMKELNKGLNEIIVVLEKKQKEEESKRNA